MSHQVIFVHGLTGGTNTFGDLPKLLLADKDLGVRVTVYIWTYPSKLFSLPFLQNSPNIQRLAESLKTTIDLEDASSVTLVCHSLGGLIARRMLLNEVKKGQVSKVKNLLLYATPNEGSGLANLGKRLSFWQPQLNQLGLNSEFLDDLNNDWHNLHLETMLNIKYIVGALDNVVNNASARGFWGNDRVATIEDGTHTNIVKPSSERDIRYRVLKKVLVQYFDSTEKPTDVVADVPVLQQASESTLPEFDLNYQDIPELVEVMHTDPKIARAFLHKPVTSRMAIARTLGLLQEGEPDNAPNKDRLSARILVRAQEQHRLGDLWSKLFNEAVDPNPYR